VTTAVGSCHRFTFPPSFPPSPVPSLIRFAWAFTGIVALVHPCIYAGLATSYPSFPPRSHPCISFPPLFRPRLCPHWHPHSRLVQILIPALLAPHSDPHSRLVGTLLAPSFGPTSRPRSHSLILALRLPCTCLHWPALGCASPHSAALALARLYSPSFVVDHPRSSLLALAGTAS